MEVSKLQVYSLGVVAANKALTSHEIEVSPIEDLPMLNGEITDNTSPMKGTGKDVSGGAYDVEVPSTVTVKAVWLPLGQANRKTSPDVRRGEKVLLYRFADSDRFYWNTMENDIRLRKLETVIYGFSANTDEGADNTAANMYYLEVSTHRKIVHFHTSNANGEPFTYDLQLNTDQGFFVIQDNIGNVFSLDSQNRTLTMKNTDGSSVVVERKSIFIEAPDLVNIKTTKYNLDATEATTKASSTHTGPILLKGNLNTAAGGGGNGTAEFSGNIKTSGNVDSSGVIHGSKVISDQAIDAPNV